MTAPEPTARPVHPSRLTPLDWAVLAVLVGVTLAVYARTRHFDFVRWDDPLYVQQNPYVQAGLTRAGLRYAATAVVSSNWHPLTLLVEMVAVQLFGASPGTFHLLSAGLHSANAGLLDLFLLLATGRRWRSAAATALWAWHPLRVESVAWVGELKDVLCGFFYLGTMLAFLWYRQHPSARRYLAVFAAMVAATLAKPMAVTLPVALLLLDYWPLRAGFSAEPLLAAAPVPAPPGWWRARVAEQLPLVLLAGAICVVTVFTQSKTGATGSLHTFPLGVRVANALDGYREYLLLTVWPHGLAIFYPHPATLGHAVPVAHWLTGAGLLVGLTALVVWVRATRPYAAVGWLWFVLTLVPVIGLVQVGLLARADRYTYLPSIGLTVAVVWAVADAAVAIGRPIGWVAVGWVTAAVLSALLTVTVQQIDHWQDERSLATHADDVVPDNYLARDSLALLAVEAGRPADAVGLARSAADLAPDVPKVHHVYGLALQAAGQMRQAFYEFEQAIKLEPRDPYVRNDFGTLLVAMHFDKDALAQFRRALALNPALPAAHLNLGAALASRGDYPAAAVEFRRALELDPQMAGAEGDLASALQRGGDPAAAVEHYRIAAEQGDGRPDTLAQLAWLTATDAGSSPHDLAAVAPLAKQACDDGQAGRQPFPWYAYSAVLARLGRFDDAINAGTRASALARSSGQAALAAAIDRRLAAYRQGWVVMGASTEPVTPPAAPARGR